MLFVLRSFGTCIGYASNPIEVSTLKGGGANLAFFTHALRGLKPLRPVPDVISRSKEIPSAPDIIPCSISPCTFVYSHGLNGRMDSCLHGRKLRTMGATAPLNTT